MTLNQRPTARSNKDHLDECVVTTNFFSKGCFINNCVVYEIVFNLIPPTHVIPVDIWWFFEFFFPVLSFLNIHRFSSRAHFTVSKSVLSVTLISQNYANMKK